MAKRAKGEKETRVRTLAVAVHFAVSPFIHFAFDPSSFTAAPYDAAQPRVRRVAGSDCSG